ncbi:thioesterase II family protein [Burkholderia sp. 22PA0099]|uniref:thioesterase II family protein n=1 Tax=Burkholderia sp. 22PA0099 TaxID=3237372 RepID=UPI0039C21B52
MNHEPTTLRPGTPRTAGTNPWLTRFGPPDAARRLRLYCFSYAGGSATIYQPWRAALDAGIELCAVQLPARGMRLAEPAERDLAALVRRLSDVIAAQDAGPFAFFGHSLGALLAFELTRHLQRSRLPLPAKLIVSGCASPQLREPVEALDEHDDDKMIERLTRYNGTPAEVLQHAELMRLMAPAIRADFALVAHYVYQGGAPLEVPITAFAGRADDQTSPEKIDGWGRETQAAFAQHWFDGDHFFIRPQMDKVILQLNAELSATALRAR